MAPAHATTDQIDAVNGVRARGCETKTVDIQPLSAQPALNETARRLADGDDLSNALTAAGYHARRSTSIHVRTTGGDIAEILAERFCDRLANPELQHFGVFRRGNDTWMVLATPFARPADGSADDIAARVIELINAARQQPRDCGREKFPAAAPLKPSAALRQAARAHARDMAAGSYLGHKGSDGSNPADRVTRAGYEWRTVAENVAAGSSTAEDVVSGWLASPGHCANLMSSLYSETGVAFAFEADSDKGTYWTQVFAAPM
jgi:uncharacterized protein YkwD